MRPDLYLVFLILVIMAMIVLTELDYGVLALLFPAIWLMGKAFEAEKPFD